MSEISNRPKSNPKSRPSTDQVVKIPSEKQTKHLKELSNLNFNQRNLENDDEKSSQLKKINSLLAEVDRLSQENSELASLLHEERMKSGEIQRKAKNSGKIKTVVDRNLQNELKHEKEEACRLRHLLKQIENERSELMCKLKDFELIVSSFSYEKKELSNCLAEKQDVITLLEKEKCELIDCLTEKNEVIGLMEKENKKLVQNLVEMNNRLADKGKEVDQLEGDRIKLCDALTAAETQKAETEQKLYFEKEKLVETTMNNQKDIQNIKVTHRKHTKAQASQNIYMILQLLTRKTYSNCLKYFNSTAARNKSREEKKNRFIIIPEKYFFRKLKYFWDHWKSKLNWTATHISRSKLLQNFQYKNFINKHFSQWRILFIQKRQKKISQFLGCEKIFKSFFLIQKKLKNKKFLVWTSKVFKRQEIGQRVFRTFYKAFLRTLKISVKVWITNTELLRGNQIVDDLATDFGALLMKSRFFYAFKQISVVKRINREFKDKQQVQADIWHGKKVVQDLHRYTQRRLMKLKILSKLNRRVYQKDAKKVIVNWKNLIKSEKQKKILDKIFSAKNKKLSEKVAEKIFYVWKEFQLSSKLQKCLNELEIEKPQRIDFQVKLKDFSQKELENKKYLASRVFRKLGKKTIFTYLYIWKSVVRGYKQGLKTLSVKIFGLGMNKLKSGFDKWRKEASFRKLAELNKNFMVKVNENVLMSEHIGLLERALDVSDTTLKTVSRLTMKSALNKLANLNLLSYLRTWAKHSFEISNKLESGKWIGNIINRAILKFKFVQIKKYCEKKLRKQVQSKKLRKFQIMLNKDTMKNTFTAWIDFSNNLRKFQKDCLRFISKKGLVLKRIFWQRWLLNKISIEQKINSENYEVLLNEKEKLNSSYQNLNNNYEKELQKSTVYFKSLKKRSQLHIFNALHRYFKGSLLTYFTLWHQNMLKNSQKSFKIIKILNLLDLNIMKKSFIKWLIFLKNHVALASQVEIKKHIHEKKVVNRAHKEAQGKLEAEISTKEIKIKQLDTILKKELRIKDYLLKRSTKQFNQEYSESRAGFAFRAMKARYEGIKVQTIQLARRIKLAQKKRAFETILETVKHQIFINNLYDKLYSTFQKYSKQYLKRLFETWKIGSYEVVIKKNQQKFRESEEKSRSLIENRETIKQKYMNEVLKLIKSSKKQAVFVAWQKIGKKFRVISNSSNKLTSTLRANRIKRTLKRFLVFVSNKKILNTVLLNSTSAYDQKQLKKCFISWKLRKIVIKSLLMKFLNFTSASISHNLSLSFAKLQFNSQNAVHHLNTLENSKFSHLKRLINAYHASQYKFVINTWKFHCIKQQENIKLLKRSILRALHRKLGKGLKTWQKVQIVQKTTEKVNRSGFVAKDNSLLQEKIQILEQLLKTEKIDSKYIDRFIQERESLDLAIKRKEVNLKNSKRKSKLLPKFFISWRLWTVKRKRILKTMQRLNCYRYKSCLLQSFISWKRTLNLLSNSISRYNRCGLLNHIKKLTISCKDLKTKLDYSQNEIIYMKAYSAILEEHTKRGQNLTMVIHKNNVKKAYFQTFLRWVVHCNLCKVHDLLTSLTRTEEKLYLAQSQLKDLTHDYIALEEDNFELRQASLDGVAIADAFETLSKEREKLSIDLEERTATVKKLMQHNSLLSFRLKQFGIEEKASPNELPRFKKY